MLCSKVLLCFFTFLVFAEEFSALLVLENSLKIETVDVLTPAVESSFGEKDKASKSPLTLKVINKGQVSGKWPKKLAKAPFAISRH